MRCLRSGIVMRALAAVLGAMAVASCSGQTSLPSHPESAQRVLAPQLLTSGDPGLEVVQTSGYLLLSSQVQSYSNTPLFGPVKTDNENCDLAGCDGDGNNWLSATGYNTGQQTSQKTLTDSHGNVMSSAAVYASSSSTWTALGKPGASVTINVNAHVQANASSSSRGASAATADSKHASNTVATTVTVSSPNQSKMTVTKLVATGTGSVGPLCQSGNCSAYWGSRWSIIVTMNGVVTAQYSSTSSPSSFGPVIIPAGSQVQVNWHAAADATAKGVDGSATGDASVTGTVKFE